MRRRWHDYGHCQLSPRVTQLALAAAQKKKPRIPMGVLTSKPVQVSPLSLGFPTLYTVLLANAGTSAELSALDGKGLDFKSDPSPRLTWCVRQNATPLDFAANAHGMAPTTSTSASRPEYVAPRPQGGHFSFCWYFCWYFSQKQHFYRGKFDSGPAPRHVRGLRGAGLYCLLISARPLGVMVRWPAASLAMKPRS